MNIEDLFNQIHDIHKKKLYFEKQHSCCFDLQEFLTKEKAQTQSLWNKVDDLKKTIASKEKEIQEGKESLEKIYIHLF